MEKDKEIIALLDGELDRENANSIKLLIEQYPELKEDKMIYDKIIQNLKKKGKLALKREIDEYLKVYLQEKSKPRVIKFFQNPVTYLSVAASIFIAMFFINLYNQSNQEDSILIFQKAESPPKLDSATYKTDTLNLPEKKYSE